jgi:hypothetical protein
MTMMKKAAMMNKGFDVYDGLPGMEKELLVCKLHISSLIFAADTATGLVKHFLL